MISPEGNSSRNVHVAIKPVIVLDLDDTIINCSLIRTPKFSFSIKIGNRKKAYVKIRPGFNEFLKEISDFFEIFFFTASMKYYANQIIDIISPDTPSDNRFYNNSCKNICGYLVKDLSLINKPMNKVLLIDDIKGSSLLQPENIINISPWNGNEDDNVLLGQLLPILKIIKNENNLSLAFRKIIQEEKDQYNDLNAFT